MSLSLRCFEMFDQSLGWHLNSFSFVKFRKQRLIQIFWTCFCTFWYAPNLYQGMENDTAAAI